MFKYKIMIAVIIVILVSIPVFVALTIGHVSTKTTSADVYFPVQKDGNLVHHELKSYGWLILEKGALRVRPFYFFGKSYLVIWPNEYSFEVEGREIRIIDRDGKVVARSGHWITIGGGPAENPDMLKNYMYEPVDEKMYAGPFYITSGVIK